MTGNVVSEPVYFGGLDLGQVRDPSALAIVERVELQGEWDAVYFAYRKRAVLRLRHLERIPLGTPYPEVEQRAREVMQSDALAGSRHLVVDGTGVGPPVVDLLRLGRLGCQLWPVMITGGNTEGRRDGYYLVPKRDLIVGLQVKLQNEELVIAGELPEGRQLVRELTEMRVKVTSGIHEQYGVWREGEHDDLVLAVALACWAAGKVYPRRSGPEWCHGRLV